ncbi:MAG: outer membrane lipoprotein chaperone LolA [Gammaproteobacteria bacterium]|nr:outer membrane lipoprotein chaperone LolA [Gammaproteobacteria bacterium]
MRRPLCGLLALLVLPWGIASGEPHVEPGMRAGTGAEDLEQAADIDPEAAKAALAAIQSYLDSVASLQATFKQVMYDAEENVTQESSGSFRLLKPGRFRWDYQEPYQQTIVADGERLWIYDADLEQVTVRAMDESLEETPAMLLSGVGAISHSYEFVNQFEAYSLLWTELKSRSTDADFGRLRLGFIGSELRVMDLIDGLGQTTRIEFMEVKQDPELSPSAFSFVPPPGADVIGEDDF